jgi:hypothetical protein
VQLENILTSYQDGDEIWHYVTPPATWEALIGCAGYMLLRKNEKIAEVWVVIN